MLIVNNYYGLQYFNSSFQFTILKFKLCNTPLCVLCVLPSNALKVGFIAMPFLPCQSTRK